MLFALYFLFTQVIYPSGFLDGAKDLIIVIMHVKKLKKDELKVYKVYKDKRQKDYLRLVIPVRIKSNLGTTPWAY